MNSLVEFPGLYLKPGANESKKTRNKKQNGLVHSLFIVCVTISSHMVVYMACKMRSRWLTFGRSFVYGVRYPEIGHFEMQNWLDTCLFDSQNTV